jgi:hypothetical protein
MKSVILAIIVAAGVGGFASSSGAAEVKKLEPHPEATADAALLHESLGLPSPTASHTGGAGAALAKPETGEPSAQGGQSITEAKHSD